MTKQHDLFDASGSLDVTTPRPPTVPDAQAERDAILDRFARGDRKHVVQALRNEAWLVWEKTRQPISVLDIRPILDRLGYDGDPRILASAFPRGDWTPVGFKPNPHAHARLIRTFMPNRVLQA